METKHTPVPMVFIGTTAHKSRPTKTFRNGKNIWFDVWRCPVCKDTNSRLSNLHIKSVPICDGLKYRQQSANRLKSYQRVGDKMLECSECGSPVPSASPDDEEAGVVCNECAGDQLTLTLTDGTTVLNGDKVRAQGEDGRWRVCRVLEILKGGGVDRAILTAPVPFGTVIRGRYQIRSCRRKLR